MRILVEKEHLRLLHAGPTLVASALAQKFHIMGNCRIIRTVTRGCVTCRHVAGQPRPQLLEQLPSDRLNPGMVFDKVGVDYARPIMVKSGPVRRPAITKAYMCVFVLFIVKAVHPRSGVKADHSSLHCLPVQIHCSMRNTNDNLECSRYEFCWSSQRVEGSLTHLGNAQTEHAIDKFCAD